MAAKPLPALGLVIGVITTYAGIVGASYATTRVTLRAVRFDNDLGRTLPWIALMLVIALVLGGLMTIPAIGAGVTTGAGLLLTVTGLACTLLPLPQTIDVVNLFKVPGNRLNAPYMLLDGSLLLFGVILLLVGIRRWAVEGRLARLQSGQGQQQGYQSTYPTQQWGGYPGQQQQPPHPAQQPQPYYPGQQPPPGPQQPGQQHPGGYPGQPR